MSKRWPSHLAKYGHCEYAFREILFAEGVMRIHSLLSVAMGLTVLAASAAAIPPGRRATSQLTCVGGRGGLSSNVLSFTLDLQTPAMAASTAGAGKPTAFSQVSVVLPAVQFIALAQAAYEGMPFQTCDLTRGNLDFSFSTVHVDDVRLAATPGSDVGLVIQASLDFATVSVTDGTTTSGTFTTAPLWSQVIFAATVATVPIF